jgi:hypothetical protein
MRRHDMQLNSPKCFLFWISGRRVGLQVSLVPNVFPNMFPIAPNSVLSDIYDLANVVLLFTL